MKSGKFEEELRRMSDIADRLSANSIVLFNESFQATNEREGSEIARQIIEALLASGVKLFCVTHMYDLARSLHDKNFDDAMFLRAARLADGTRTFKLVPAVPQPTSHGRDLYEQIFGAEAGCAAGPDFAAAPPGRVRGDQTEPAEEAEAPRAPP